MTKRFFAPLILLATTLIFVPELCAQFDNDKPEETNGPQYGDEVTQRWQVGVRIEATRSNVIGLYVTVPVPADWPEQSVRVVDEDYSTNVSKVGSRVLDGGVKQMLVNIPQIRAGDQAHAIVTLEVTTRSIAPPKDTSIFSIAKRMPREVKKALGTSPFIDARSSTVRKLVKEITEPVEGDWNKVDALLQWTRANIEPSEGKMKGALPAIRERAGTDEDVVNVFVALCRAAKVPARIVWINQSYYAEFYLADDENNGYWFPVSPLGNSELGAFQNPTPILQKGDNIKVPEMEDLQRYVPELVKGKKGGSSARVMFVRELLANE